MDPPSYTLTIPQGYAWLNANDRLHWTQQRALTRGWRADAAWEARRRRVPRLDRARIVATVSFPDNRRRDVGNLQPTLKAIVDGLVQDYGLLPDDDDTHLEGPDLRRGPKVAGRPVVVLTITDLSGATA